MKQNIINIINFIRGVDERADFSIVEPVKEQIRLIDRYGFKATFLIQYDALLMPEYTDILKKLDPSRYELGLWYEIPKPLCLACGIPWISPLLWDHHCWCDFPVGYTKEQRSKLIDEAFRKFKEVFGYYPGVMGSWFFDSFTVRHIEEKYGLDTLCNCKEQYGTDGYTLWGGYYGQGYYPAKKNVFFPAQTKEEQIGIPVFRMLRSDQVYQYDFGMNINTGAAAVQGVITLEPVYKESGGGNPNWVDWYLKENYNGECLSFSYSQSGQENSFGWEAMKDGLFDQFAKIKQMKDADKLSVETLGETGRAYQKEYTATPASTVTSHTAFDDPLKKSVWYCSKHYRINLYSDQNGLRIRNIQKFDENYTDRYEDSICTGNDAAYDALPVFDGNLYSGNGTVAGIYLHFDSDIPFIPDTMRFTKQDEATAKIVFAADKKAVSFTLSENGFALESELPYTLDIQIGNPASMPAVSHTADRIVKLSHNGFSYLLSLEQGILTPQNTVLPENGTVKISFV